MLDICGGFRYASEIDKFAHYFNLFAITINIVFTLFLIDKNEVKSLKNIC